MSLGEMLKQRGFAVIPGFLTEDEVAGFAGDYRDGGTLGNQMYSLGAADPARVDAIKPRIRSLVIEPAEDSGLTINFIGGGAFFATERGINFYWHQDHESYFMHQTHANYLNLYIPVIKPDPSKTNLSIIPADNFASRCPELWIQLKDGGASSIYPQDGRFVVTNDCEGGHFGALDFDVEELAETPQLAAGDALLLRGDIYHKTQDTLTDRVALSIRMFNDQHTVTRDHFAASCQTKDAFLTRNAEMYDRIRRVFDANESLTFRQLMNQAYSA